MGMDMDGMDMVGAAGGVWGGPRVGHSGFGVLGWAWTRTGWTWWAVGQGAAGRVWGGPRLGHLGFGVLCWAWTRAGWVWWVAGDSGQGLGFPEGWPFRVWGVRLSMDTGGLDTVGGRAKLWAGGLQWPEQHTTDDVALLPTQPPTHPTPMTTRFTLHTLLHPPHPPHPPNPPHPPHPPHPSH
jgi:hypothetical protein